MSSIRVSAVQSKGIYHGMPVYPNNIKGLHALVVGASGISGQAMVAALAENPERWSQIYAVSRKKPSVDFGPSVKHVLVDLLDGPEAIATSFRTNGVKV
jgi:5,10-methylene-tetrahydrofolate dehydrogenase/methenyl tetrahydrofolate cyclohydrolase